MPNRRPTPVTRRSLVTALAVLLVLLFAAPASAHHADIQATVRCIGRVSFTVHAWRPGKPTAAQRTNPSIENLVLHRRPHLLPAAAETDVRPASIRRVHLLRQLPAATTVAPEGPATGPVARDVGRRHQAG